MCAYNKVPVDLLDALRLISVTISLDTCVVNCSKSENFSCIVLGGAFPKTCQTETRLYTHISTKLFSCKPFSTLHTQGPVGLRPRLNQASLSLCLKSLVLNFWCQITAEKKLSPMISGCSNIYYF